MVGLEVAGYNSVHFTQSSGSESLTYTKASFQMLTKLFGSLAIVSGLFFSGASATPTSGAGGCCDGGGCCSEDCCEGCPDCDCNCPGCENCADGCDCTCNG